MTAFDLLAAASASGAPTRLDPVRLFMDADIVVKIVMAGLLLASLWTWTIIVAFWLRMGTLAHEADELADRLNFLATVGSVAPFVGLFGTVWGIMNSFFQIGSQESSSLAVVAPGISEALFATAIGLFAAIPAVIAYNRFSHRVNRYESQLQRFADRLHASFSRQLEA